MFIPKTGPRQTTRTNTTMAMSAATFFSRLNIIDSCCSPTWPTIWRLWRRMAINILKWLIAGSRINETMEINCRMNRKVSGRKAWSKIVTESQTDVVMNAAFFASVEKRKMCYPSPSSISSSNMTRSPNKRNWIQMFIAFYVFF